MMKERNKTEIIIFHHSLSYDVSANEIKMWHSVRGFEDIGYHFVIRKNGMVENGRDLRLVGAHALHRNHNSLGVCFTGNFNKHAPEEEQYESAAILYKKMCEVYGMLKIEFHRTERNPCPGLIFNRDKFIKMCERW